MDDFDYLLETIADIHHDWIISIDSGGEPPSLGLVANSYREIEREVALFWQLSELIEFQKKGTNIPKWALARINMLKEIESLDPISRKEDKYDSFRHSICYEDTSFPEPKTSVILSKHVNPLITSIGLVASTMSLLVISTIWSIRQFNKMRGERILHEQSKVLLTKIANVISDGNKEQIEAIIPLAREILREGFRNVDSGGKISLRPGSITLESREKK